MVAFQIYSNGWSSFVNEKKKIFDRAIISQGQSIVGLMSLFVQNIYSVRSIVLLFDESTRMYYSDVSLFDDLSTELIREIFDYLAPHHLLGAFENLNSRFSSIITQHTFCLPKIDMMSRQLYQYYITYIIPKYACQFRLLHFSNDPTVGAIDEFLRTINNNIYSVLAISLRAIEIFDITEQTFQLLIDHFHHFYHVANSNDQTPW